MGRFSRLDPFAGNSSDPQSLHKYLYAHANPVMGIDPSGELFSYIGQLARASVEAVINAIRLAPTFAARAGARIFTQSRIIHSYALRVGRFFYDPRSFRTISRVYWAAQGGARGASLHHWLIPQRWSFIPAGIRNAGFNLLHLPKVLRGNLGINQWMGFALRWGGWKMTVAMTIENGIRVLIPLSLYGGAGAGIRAGQWLDKQINGAEAIDLEDGATAVPLELEQSDVLDMQEAVLEDIEDDPAFRDQ